MQYFLAIGLHVVIGVYDYIVLFLFYNYTVIFLLEDEFYFLLFCSKFKKLRLNHFPLLFCANPCKAEFKLLMSPSECKLIKEILHALCTMQCIVHTMFCPLQLISYVVRSR